MKATTVHRLPFPEPGDYSNGALALQYLATEVDTDLAVDLAGYQKFDQLGMGISTVTSNSIGYAANTLVQVGFDTIEYTDAGFNIIPGQGGTTIRDPAFNGWYRIGGWLSLNQLGATTANSFREMQLINSPLPGATGPGGTAIYHARTYTNGTGNDELSLEVTAFLYYGCQLNMFLLHNNAASNIQYLAGTRLWVAQIVPDVS